MFSLWQFYYSISYYVYKVHFGNRSVDCYEVSRVNGVDSCSSMAISQNAFKSLVNKEVSNSVTEQPLIFSTVEEFSCYDFTVDLEMHFDASKVHRMQEEGGDEQSSLEVFGSYYWLYFLCLFKNIKCSSFVLCYLMNASLTHRHCTI